MKQPLVEPQFTMPRPSRPVRRVLAPAATSANRREVRKGDANRAPHRSKKRPRWFSLLLEELYWANGYRPLEVWGPNERVDDRGQPLKKPWQAAPRRNLAATREPNPARQRPVIAAANGRRSRGAPQLD
jgi:hypothetical protein